MIQEAAQHHAPEHNITPRSKTWWSEDISTERKHMNSALKDWKVDRQPQQWEEYQATWNKFFRVIREKETEHWDKCLANARSKDIFTAMKYSKPRRCEKTPTLHANDTTATTFREKAYMFRTSLFPPFSELNITETEAPRYRQIDWNDATNTEIGRAIKAASPHSAPGPDRLSTCSIQQAYEALPDRFHCLFKAILQNAYHPKPWREATVVIIPKLGMADNTIPKAYRPILLLNCIGKVSERLMAARISQITEKYNLLHRW